jgi:ribosomal protein S18 acetylase RimI-like enzyme
LHTDRYGESMNVRPLDLGDVDEVVAIVGRRLALDAARNPLVNAAFSDENFAIALGSVRERAWVAVEHGRVVGHLVGALLNSPEYGRGAWWGPDGISFDSLDTLAALYSAAGAAWIAADALEHYGWVFDDRGDVDPWYELGFARMHERGVLALGERTGHDPPSGYRLRRGGPADLDLAVELDEELDRAQREGPSFAILAEHTSRREDLLEILEDEEVHHYVVEHDGRGVAQCLSFPLDERRGSHPRSVHLSAVTVARGHEQRGVATALVDAALLDAASGGFTHAETNWRVTNRRAAHFWRRYGFIPTYVRLHRTIGAG